METCLYFFPDSIAERFVKASKYCLIFVDIREAKLETTVPKRHGDELIVIRGQYRGELGRLMERDDRSYRVIVSLPNLRKQVELHFDDVCRTVSHH